MHYSYHTHCVIVYGVISAGLEQSRNKGHESLDISCSIPVHHDNNMHELNSNGQDC